MAESGPIKYEELFAPDLDTRMTDLVGKINEVKKAFDDMSTDIKSKAQGLSDALSGSSSATKGGRDNTQAQAAQADALYASYQQLKEGSKALAEQMAALSKAEENNKKIVDTLKTANDNFAGVLERLKAEAELAATAIGKMGTGANSAELKQLQQTVKSLEGQVKNLEKSLSAGAKALGNTTKNASKSKQELLSYDVAFKTLAETIDLTKINFDELQLSEKAQQQISKNGEAANKALKGSYNQLAAQYNLVKTVLNSMSEEMVKNTEIGKQMEAEALRLRNAMKAYQESTGVSTLSVGDYGKALNGLSISTQQVLREMPTLANSMQQFFIAISNNVPIFVDNFKRASSELGGFTKAVGATLKVVFSWQTVLLVILTILPKIAKAIHDKRKAQEEANKETEKAVTYAELLAEAEKARFTAITNEITKLQFLKGVLQDNNRAWEDRIKAAEIMKKEWKEEFQNFSTEQILAGEAKTAIDKLTEALVTQAEAKAYLNQIGELSIKLYDLEQDRAKARAQQMQEEAKLAHLLIEDEAVRRQAISDVEIYGQTTEKTQAAIIASENAIKKQREAIEDAGAAYRRADNQMQQVENTISNLKDRIKLAGLDIVDSNGNVTDSILDIPSYYNDALKAIIDGMEDGLQKELALLDYGFKVQREKRLEQEAKLKEMMDKATNDEKARIEAELSNLALAMVAEEQNYLEARKKMLNSFMSAEVEEEPDYEEQMRKNIETALTVEKRLRDAAAYENYERGIKALENNEKNAKSEIELKRELNAALLDSEEQYWKDYLSQLRDEGVLTVEEYNKIMAQLSKGTPSSSQTSTRKKRGTANYRNVTEVAFAMNPITGYKDENGIARIKDEYLDLANSVNTAIQTSIDYMNEWMDKRIEMAELAVEKAREEAEEAKTALDYESEARANGYANNVELARKEYAEKKRMEQEAIAEQKRLQKIQEEINTSQQIGALVTATANLWSGYSEIPIVGPALAIAATALMWGSFIAAKVQAAQVARYGEGMAEYLDYGGSHASGHDIDFGRTKDGKQRRVERGEVVGVIRKDKVQKYGVDKVLDIINSLNNGTYNDRVMSSDELLSNVFGETPESAANLAYLRAKVGDMLGGGESLSMGLKTPITANSGIDYSSAFEGARALTDLSVLERGVGELIKQGELRVVQTAEGRIEYRGNNKRIIRNG